MLPEDFIDYTSKLFGEQRWQAFLSSFREDVPVSIRINPFKVSREQEKEILAELSAESTAVPWCCNAFWLSSRPRFTSDPLFHAGAYYVQEAGSMFLDRVLRTYVSEPVTMLDLCAAPGGKSTLARAALPESSLLFTNEPDRHRANILMENMVKQGHEGVVVTNCYAEDYAKERIAFDVILVDAPCSGEGLFRRDNAAIGEWSMRNVRKCAELQQSILRDIWNALAPGGLLVYSTCTFNVMENEENVLFLMREYGAEVLPVPVEAEWGICPSLHAELTEPVYRFIPGTTKSEGLFMSVLRKPGTLSPAIPDKQKILSKIKKGIHILYDGVPRGEQKGRDIIPSHAEALAINNHGGYPIAKVSKDEALRYLHREPLVLPSDTPRGFVMLAYHGLPLGFVKNIGNRANNLYPKEWAIRSL